MTHALEVRDLVKSFRQSRQPGRPARWRRVLTGVSLQVPRGEVFGILGPNGSGKSTLVRVIATLLYPDSGQVKVFGRDAQREPLEVRRMIARVSPDAAFFKKLSPLENLTHTARLYGLAVPAARVRAAEILARLGLPARRLNEPLQHMSRGMQQKVAIARAFLTQPVLLLLDEPTTGLDPRSKREVQAFIREMHRDHDATTVLTTQDMNEADQLCNRVLILHRGQAVALGTPAELKARHGNDGTTATLEDVFLHLTGHELEEEETDE